MKETWYKMYPYRWLLSRQVMKMTMSQKGLYIHAINLSFTENGFIDKDLLLSEKKECSENDVNIVLKQFKEIPDKKFFHPLILKQIDYLNKLSEAGKRGNLKRWNPEEYDMIYGTSATYLDDDKKKLLESSESPNTEDRGIKVSPGDRNASPDKIRRDKKRKEEAKKEEKNVPAKEDFISYGISQKPNVSVSSLVLKYEAWKENDWHNGNGKKIKNWKSTLLNTLPYMKEKKSKEFIIK